MRRHSLETKEEAVRKLYTGTAAKTIAEELGVSTNAIYSWSKSIGKNQRESHNPSASSKADLIIEYQKLKDSERGQWLRSKGYESAHVEQWIRDLKKEDDKSKKLREENRNLKEELKLAQREIRKKDKALAESAALLVLKKKYQHLWEDEEA